MKLEEELVYFKGKGYNKTIILVEISMIEEEMMQNNILFLLIFASIILVINYTPVSYTHLDVYKRQL